MRSQEGEILGRVFEPDFDRRRKAAQQRRHGPLVDAGKAKPLLRFAHIEDPRGTDGCRFAFELERNVPAVRTDQPDRQRDVEGCLRQLPGGDRRVLRHLQAVDLRAGIVRAADIEYRRAGLAVPAPKLREIDRGGILHGLREIVAGDRLPVVALEIQVHALAEAVGSQQRVLHADDFGALFVNGRRVEVVDLEILVGSHVVGHRPRVFGELFAAKELDRGDAFDRAGIRVTREFLVPENGEPFLERELEPVAAGHAVAGPVVEVLVADHRFDGAVVIVGRGVGIGEHQPAVEDVETLVLHRPHVEVVGAKDHEGVEVVFPAEALLVPAERALQRFHRVPAPRQVAWCRVDLERDPTTRHRSERILERT